MLHQKLPNAVSLFTVKFLHGSLAECYDKQGTLVSLGWQTNSKLLEIRNSSSLFFVFGGNLTCSGKLKNLAGNTGILKITE